MGAQLQIATLTAAACGEVGCFLHKRAKCENSHYVLPGSPAQLEFCTEPFPLHHALINR